MQKDWARRESPQFTLPLAAADADQGHHSPLGCKHQIVGLFAGIGGFELGLSRAGHETVLLCENDPAAMAVLRAHFPQVVLHDDVSTLDCLPEGTSLIVAGFPCQDLSQAGTTKGITGARSGLISEVFRLVRKHHTPWVLLENVPFMLQLARGEAMNIIAFAFEELGYKWAYRVVDTRSFGLPQRRRRVYFLASRTEDPRTSLFADEDREVIKQSVDRVACGFYWTEGLRGLGWAVDAVPTLKGGSSIGIPSPPAILLTSGRIVTPDVRDAERLQGFPADWTRPAERIASKGSRWKLVGNAVSVPIAAWLGDRLMRPSAPQNFDVAPLREHSRWPTAAWNVAGRRMAVIASERPVRRPYHALEQFLLYPCPPLSARATRGFLHRAERATLHFPPGLLDSLRAHLSRPADESPGEPNPG
jgi:DNA (cytosine-5)-methyltransferase 1